MQTSYSFLSQKDRTFHPGRAPNFQVLLRPNPEGFVLCELEGIKEERVWKDVTSNSLAGIRTEARAASRTHFYGSGIWVNVPKGRYDTCFREQCDRRS